MTDPHGSDAATSVPATVNTGAIAAFGLDLQEGPVDPAQAGRFLGALGLGDPAVQLGHPDVRVLALYLDERRASSRRIVALAEGDPVRSRARDLASRLGLAIGVAGLLIALLAPVLGQRADAAGRRKLWLGVFTGPARACSRAVLRLRRCRATSGSARRWSLGSVFGEIAGVNYNAMLVQVSTPTTVGRVSGLGWGLGYLGGIVALVIVVVAQLRTGSASRPTTASNSGVVARRLRGVDGRLLDPDLPQRARAAADRRAPRRSASSRATSCS